MEIKEVEKDRKGRALEFRHTASTSCTVIIKINYTGEFTPVEPKELHFTYQSVGTEIQKTFRYSCCSNEPDNSSVHGQLARSYRQHEQHTQSPGDLGGALKLLCTQVLRSQQFIYEN